MAAGVGIDSGTRATRVVRLVRKGDRVRWGGAVSVPQTPLAPADAPAGESAPTAELPRADALRARLREAGIRPRGAVAGLAGKDVIIRYSRVPPVPAWKLRMLVGYEATQNAELDVAFDYRLLNLPVRIDSNELTVMIAIAKNDVLEKQLGSLAEQGIRGVDFAPDSLALYEVFRRCAEADEALDQYCLVLDVGATKTEMIVVLNGGLVFARSVAYGGSDFTKSLAAALDVTEERAERLKTGHGEIVDDDELASRPSAERPMLRALADAAEEFFGAIRASLMFARAQTKLVDLEVGRVYLSGAGASLAGLAGFLSARLGARVTPFAPPDEWNVPGEANRPSEWMLGLGLALIALEPPEERISLLPPRARKRRTFRRRDVFAYAACAAFALAACAAAVVQLHNWSAARTALAARSELADQARQRDGALVELIAGNETRADHIVLLGSAAGAGARLAEFIEQIKKAPQGPITLSKLVFTAGDANRPDARAYVTLFGTVGQSTRTHQDALTDFWRQLSQSPWFDPPDRAAAMPVEQARTSPDGKTMEFQLRIPLRLGPAAGRKGSET